MTIENSPYYTHGLEDGQRDTERIAQCPPLMPLGMDEERSWSSMYRRGYSTGYVHGKRHKCTEKCADNATISTANGPGSATVSTANGH